MEFSFNHATDTDLSLILSLLKESAEALQQKGLQQWKVWLAPQKEQLNWIKSGLQNQEFLFATDASKNFVGMFRLSSQDELYWGIQRDRAVYLHSLLVKKEFSGQNIGSKIISQIETELQGKNIPLLRLDCHSGNQWLCNYYESLGFIRVGQKQMPHSLNNLYQKDIRHPEG